ncbi:MAG TPA: ATP-binding cassette domain-containing protein [Bryobacteraceae bacterium]|nr:ATP-binding cassette domain-containing protein [Bryobacteraceae bacterium]
MSSDRAGVLAPPMEAAVDQEDLAIHVHNLWKLYGDVEAVQGIDLDVRRGEIFGLIGPDGAGKTTTFQILAGVMPATSGDVQILGRSARDARPEVGYLTQVFSLYPDLTVSENIRYVGDLRHVPRREMWERAGRYLEMFDMHRFTTRLAGRLSGGMKQKLALTCALVAQPKILLLDEPTTGVDPVSRREFWDTLAHLVADGLTILVATPYLDEAERCHRVALMHLGEIHEVGTPAQLRLGLQMKRLEVWTNKLSEAEDFLRNRNRQANIAQTSIADVQRFGDRLDVMTSDVESGRKAISEQLLAAGLELIDLRVGEPTLENTFVAKLRALGQELNPPPYPGRHPHRDRKDQIAIGARGLSKRFGSFQAVNHVNVEIKYGEIYGLLGANGAGKTTTIKMLCGLLEPTSGEMMLAGEHGSLRSTAVRHRIGYMSQKFSLYDDMTIEENLDFFAGVYGVPEDEIEEKKKWVMAFAGLAGKESQLTGSLPGGWKQRVAFGAAILHEPSVLFLDEPTSGVDPLARRAFWRMINTLADMGTAILVTTHYLEEAEQCNRLGFMVAGELAAEGTPSGIKSEQTGHLLEIMVGEPQRAADLLKSTTERWRVSLFGDRLHVITDDDVEKGTWEVVEKLQSAGIEPREVHEERFSLEDVFIVVVEKARQEGKVAADD